MTNTSSREVTRDHSQASPVERVLNPAGSPRRKIVFLVSHFPAGGAQEILTNLAEGLAGRGFDVKLLALYPLAHAGSFVQGSLAWSCAYGQKPKSIFGIAGMVRAFLKAIRDENPYAIISALPAANVAAMFAGGLMAPDAKVIITHHSPVETHSRLLNRADGWLGNWRNVASIVSVSNAVAASLDSKPAPYLAKRRTIMNALPPAIEQLLADLAVQRGAHKVTRTVVATGRLSRQKNYPVLLRAATHLPNVKIKIVGGGEDEQELKALANSLGVQDRVEFLGRRSRQETLQILADGDVFAQPSLFEGHSLALIEAAKLNVPIVVSNVPVQVEGVTAPDGSQCGIIVEPEDDLALANEIRRLLDDPLCYAQWTERARHLAEAIRFEDMVTAYQEILN